MPRLRRLTAREIVRILEDAGFEVDRTRGEPRDSGPDLGYRRTEGCDRADAPPARPRHGARDLPTRWPACSRGIMRECGVTTRRACGGRCRMGLRWIDAVAPAAILAICLLDRAGFGSVRSGRAARRSGPALSRAGSARRGGRPGPVLHRADPRAGLPRRLGLRRVDGVTLAVRRRRHRGRPPPVRLQHPRRRLARTGGTRRLQRLRGLGHNAVAAAHTEPGAGYERAARQSGQ